MHYGYQFFCIHDGITIITSDGVDKHKPYFVDWVFFVSKLKYPGRFVLFSNKELWGHFVPFRKFFSNDFNGGIN